MAIYNFSAGPATLPKPVLELAQRELLDYQGSGMSVMELSHRQKEFDEIIKEAEVLLRELMAIPDNYKVLFLQGGASTQFTMIPLNLAKGKTACYVEAGSWGKKAYGEAKKLSEALGTFDVKLIASSADKNYAELPEINPTDIPEDAAYLHITTNNTIEGTTWYKLPETNGVPIVGDMSSNIMSVRYNVDDFALIYAGAQKNIGPAGVTVVIIREDFLNEEPALSSMLDYKIQADNDSLYNTPPTFAIYIAKLVFEWVKSMGGVDEIERLNTEKANLLYTAIDNSKLFSSPVKKSDRSLNNIPFVTPTKELDALFNKEADAAGFKNIKGHRSVGGMRASIYNAFPLQGVLDLIAFMEEFEKNNG